MSDGAGRPARAASMRAQSQSTGRARATRQKALAKGPLSARRTKVGEAPIATAPRRSAAKGKAKPASGAGMRVAGKGGSGAAGEGASS